MNKALIKAGDVTLIEADILDAEQAIDRAMITEGETWVEYALQLERIKKDFERAKTKTEKPFGLNSFNAYINSDRSRFQKSQCSDYVLALPDYRLAKSSAIAEEINWTEGALREVRKLKTTVAKKSALKTAAADHADNGTPLGTAVKNAVAKKKTLRAEIDKLKSFNKETDPAANLKALIRFTEKHLDALVAQPRAFWKAAEESSPGIAATAATVVGKLAALLRRM